MTGGIVLPYPCSTIPCAPTGMRLVKSTLYQLNKRMPPLKTAWPMGQKLTRRGRLSRCYRCEIYRRLRLRI